MLSGIPSKAILMMMVVATCSALKEEGSERSMYPGYSGMQYGNSFYGGSNNNKGVYFNQGAVSPFPLSLDSSCKRYTCTSKPGMRTGSCDMTCSPDRINTHCPVINCVSASPGICGNLRCEVATYSHVLY